MRRIVKTTLGSNVLERQHRQPPQSSKEATQRWKDFNKKSVVRNKLEAQQEGLCAYTEFNIASFRSKTSSTLHGCHIEHIKPKTHYPQETFDYFNVVLCTLDSSDLARFNQDFFINETPEEDDSQRELFGAPAKGSHYDAALFISPLEADCQRYFTYLEEDGKIVPAAALNGAETQRATYTIELLNLNHPYLKNQRRKRMAEVLEDIDEYDLTAQQAVISAEISPDNQGYIASFPSAVASLVIATT